MRINPFSKVERESSNHCRGDCSYINDFGSGVFERVCQLESSTAYAMIKAGVAGYEECECGEVNSYPGYLGTVSWAEAGNKDFVALWVEDPGGAENTKIFGIYNHDGKFYLTTCNITKLKMVLMIKPHLHISDRMIDGIVKAFGDYWLKKNKH
jgi:hypothetical protein